MGNISRSSIKAETDRYIKAVKKDGLEASESDLIPEGELQTVLFRKREIRQIFHDNEWYSSVIDVIEAVCKLEDGKEDWARLKQNISERGYALSEVIQLEMESSDGSVQNLEAANTETLFRLIQSLDTPSAEPFKKWLAKVGYERIQEFQNPEIAIKRAILLYQLQGRSDDWIDARIRTLVSRKELTGEWRRRGVSEGKEFAILTNIIGRETFGLGVKGHKHHKGLKKNHNLRDHMTEIELILTMLGERSTTEIAQHRDAYGFDENHEASEAGGRIAGDARKQLETQLGRSVVSNTNFLTSRQKSKKNQRRLISADC